MFHYRDNLAFQKQRMVMNRFLSISSRTHRCMDTIKKPRKVKFSQPDSDSSKQEEEHYAPLPVCWNPISPVAGRLLLKRA